MAILVYCNCARIQSLLSYTNECVESSINYVRNYHGALKLDAFLFDGRGNDMGLRQKEKDKLFGRRNESRSRSHILEGGLFVSRH